MPSILPYARIRKVLNHVVEHSRPIAGKKLAYPDGLAMGYVPESLKRLGIVGEPVRLTRREYFGDENHPNYQLFVYPVNTDLARYWLERVDEAASAGKKTFNLDKDFAPSRINIRRDK